MGHSCVPSARAKLLNFAGGMLYAGASSGLQFGCGGFLLEFDGPGLASLPEGGTESPQEEVWQRKALV